MAGCRVVLKIIFSRAVITVSCICASLAVQSAVEDGAARELLDRMQSAPADLLGVVMDTSIANANQIFGLAVEHPDLWGVMCLLHQSRIQERTTPTPPNFAQILSKSADLEIDEATEHRITINSLIFPFIGADPKLRSGEYRDADPVFSADPETGVTAMYSWEENKSVDDWTWYGIETPAVVKKDGKAFSFAPLEGVFHSDDTFFGLVMDSKSMVPSMLTCGSDSLRDEARLYRVLMIKLPDRGIIARHLIDAGDLRGWAELRASHNSDEEFLDVTLFDVHDVYRLSYVIPPGAERIKQRVIAAVIRAAE